MSAYPNPVYVVKAVRTPVAKSFKGHFSQVRPDDLLCHTIGAITQSVAKLDPKVISDVIVGCAMPEGMQGLNVGRLASLLAGLPESVPGMTVNRFCASGVQSVAIGANQIALGQADFILAGGVESMTAVPMGGFHPSINPLVFRQKGMTSIAYNMGTTAEVVAERFAIERDAQDQFAFDSHQKALRAIKLGRFNDEIEPYVLKKAQPCMDSGEIKTQRVTIDQDEGPRKNTTLEALARLKPVFKLKGSVTAGNSSQISDGAGMVLLASEAGLKQFGLEPVAEILGYQVSGLDPAIMGMGPVEAMAKVLTQTQLKQDDIDWIELNEAFAAQALAVIGQAHLDPDRVNPRGGAIALGHPLGATGAIRLATIISGMRQSGQKHGVVTMCIGAGMGAAMVVKV